MTLRDFDGHCDPWRDSRRHPRAGITVHCANAEALVARARPIGRFRWLVDPQLAERAIAVRSLARPTSSQRRSQAQSRHSVSASLCPCSRRTAIAGAQEVSMRRVPDPRPRVTAHLWPTCNVYTHQNVDIAKRARQDIHAARNVAVVVSPDGNAVPAGRPLKNEYFHAASARECDGRRLAR